MIRMFVLAAAFAGALAAQPAAAGTIAVRTADLNLSTAAGRATLDARITGAAHSLCRVEGVRPLSDLMESARCYRQAVASAHPQLAQRDAGDVRSTS